jgi:hypothetical protein
MFADDISVLISDSDTSELQIKIGRVVTELETWSNRNDLVINTGKTGAMSFHKGQPHFLVKPLVTFNKTAVACTSENNSCYTDLQNKHDGTVWVLILTAPLLIGHLWCYCTANAMTTFDRQSVPGILEVRSGVPLYKI